MPLAVICGIPNAGKTFVAKALIDFLEKKNRDKKIIYISEETLQIDKKTGFSGKSLVVRFDWI